MDNETPRKPTRVTLDEEGISVDLGKIKSIGIENILDLKAYNMSREGDRIMHVLEFSDGGTCEVTYLVTGKLEVFNGHRLSVQISKDGVLTIKKYNPAS